MPKYDIDEAKVSDYSGLSEWTPPIKDTDGVVSKETEWQNTRWGEQWGLFNSVPELHNALLMRAIWNTGKGWTANNRATAILERLSGWGKDTFDDIIFNQDVISMVGGDSYSEIILGDDGSLLNLKPLNPGTMKIIVGENGRIKRYEQTVKGKKNKSFDINKIFHLSYNRLADQIHGISKIDAVKPIILADEASFEDMQKIMRFQAKPFVIFKLKTDNTTKIATFADKIRDVRRLGEDLFIPDDENLLSWEVVQISPAQIIMDWRNDLRNKFYRAVGLPQIVPGAGGQSTESESRVIYLAFEHLVAQRQLYLQAQIFNQLGLKVKFNSPTTLADLIGKDNKKDAAGNFATRPSELNPNATRQ